MAKHPPVTHPVVRTHPVSGRKGLFVNEGFTTHINELSAPESQALLAFLFAHAGRPELTVRWHWSVNDVAFWDNRLTQHYAVADYLPERRTMHRATVNGDDRSSCARAVSKRPAVAALAGHYSSSYPRGSIASVASPAWREAQARGKHSNSTPRLMTPNSSGGALLGDEGHGQDDAEHGRDGEPGQVRIAPHAHPQPRRMPRCSKRARSRSCEMAIST